MWVCHCLEVLVHTCPRPPEGSLSPSLHGWWSSVACCHGINKHTPSQERSCSAHVPHRVLCMLKSDSHPELSARVPSLWLFWHRPKGFARFSLLHTLLWQVRATVVYFWLASELCFAGHMWIWRFPQRVTVQNSNLNNWRKELERGLASLILHRGRGSPQSSARSAEARKTGKTEASGRLYACGDV